MHKFKELIVWQKGMNLVKEIYGITHSFPDNELFGITSQMKQSAISIPSNIAEGCGRNTDKELNHFLNIANGSSFELETLVILSFDLGYLEQEEFNFLDSLLDEIQKMIYGFKQSIQTKSSPHS
jgi:four helix bundle protein